MAYEEPLGSAVYLDVQKRAWAFACPLPPLEAPEKLYRKDNHWWRSDLSCTRGDSRDVIEITVPRGRPAAEGSLVVHAINRYLFTSVYESIFRFPGDESIQFAYALEHDPELVNIIKN